jgi:type II secretory pathway component PulF
LRGNERLATGFLRRAKTSSEDDDWRAEWRCTRQELLIFTRQLATLIASGVPIIPSLEALIDSELGTLSTVIEDISKKIMNGFGLAISMAAFPKIFSRVYISMIRVAETTGNLPGTLERLADWLEADQDVIRKTKSVMTYPLIVIGVTGLLTLGLFTNVMPGFVTIFEEMDVQLPLLTQILVVITKTVTSGFGWVVGLLVIFTIGYLSLPIIRSEKGQHRIFAFLLMLPILGPTLEALTIGRFCAVAGMMLRSGASLLSVMQLSAIASGSPVLIRDSKDLLNAISEGEYLAEYMSRNPHIYPRTLAQVVSVGENTSRLDYLLDKFSTLYAEDLDTRLDDLANALEPLLLTGAATVVGFVLAGIFLPLYGFLGQL